ncbi:MULTISPECIES: rRNA maturation RNase YbeY [Chryseobacterium]|jgi:probable rRNA maturation factor|uniref:Endoribonuclease YbeY n=5 Tax=Chryseobacterium TaxID=59732 RepID=A0A1N7M8L4_9FLAO|nr:MULTISPECIES: rRNA maturation RNase YbeY [Chryseobacterium]NPA09899.1 rRNA maturation RNase YbeY [Chlorobiota bacterium]HAO09110.1 rRNA maturation RNase YbeY [Chryseobacterium sp.]MBL7880694.1 rRNA maturation RNase YbeY [Chryseobacterium gambrini]MCF2220797.1 rRNA maturation RNase YbeY [Chryseobacterium sp. PS-8]MCQ4140274.1 rRNA maturation RNase YbeY [Chryseobacterium sp. EO14]
MIQFFYENLPESVNTEYKKWLEDLILSEEKKLGEINYIFCDDEYLLKVNQDYLQHDYYTDIITFDYVKGKTISGEIFVSLQRISDNASTLSRNYEEELRRVLAHGILHLCGYKDKTEEEELQMRGKEDHYLAKYH